MSLIIDLGNDCKGNIIEYDITRMPHCLISGVAASGKTVVIDSMIVSLIQNYNSDYVKVLIADFNNNEFNVYNNIPHLLHPLITTSNEFIDELDYLIDIINERYVLLRDSGCFNIKEYNQQEEAIPYIVMFIDEISQAFDSDINEDDINNKLNNILVKGRAVGVHIVTSIMCQVVNRIKGFNLSNFNFRIVLPCLNAIQYWDLLEQKIPNVRLNPGEMIIRDCNGEMVKGTSIYYTRKEIISICDKIKY